MRLLVAEDNPADVYLIREALSAERLDFTLDVVDDGEKAVHYAEVAGTTGFDPCPDLVLLDLHLPKRSGGDFLRTLRSNPGCRETPVIVLTSSESPADRLLATELGVTEYFKKPTDFMEFMKLGPIVRQLWTARREAAGFTS